MTGDLDRHRVTLEALMNRIDRIPRNGRPSDDRRLLAAQSEALGVAIRMMQDALTDPPNQRRPNPSVTSKQ